MAVSNKKRKAILRGYPDRSIDDLAEELKLGKGEVKSVLREEGRLDRRSLKLPLAALFGVAVLGVVGFFVFKAVTKPGPARLGRMAGDLNLLFITIDTLRADHLGCYGYQDAETPVLDALAAGGARFEYALAHQPLTLPSHATIFTGTHPRFHGVNDNGHFKLKPEASTMAEVLKDQGLETGAIISAYVLHHQYGLDQGFNFYDDSLSPGREEHTAGFEEMKANLVSDRAIKWISNNADKRWFLWLHYYDPHADYLPPRDFMKTRRKKYDAEIAFVDHEIGRVIETIADKGITDKTLIVVTSDHGESLGEHGEDTHSMFVYECAMRVPLIISLPGAIPAGRTTSRPVRLMDLMPTALEALNAPAPTQVQGRSLLPLLFEDPEGRDDPPVVMQTHAPWYGHAWSPIFAIRDGGFKFIRSPKPELYDLGADPGELTNIYSANRGRAEQMARELKRLETEYEKAALGDSSIHLDDRAKAKLMSLGYIFDGPGMEEGATDAPDVKDMIDLARLIKKSYALKTKGQHEEAIAVLKRIIERSPRDRTAFTRMGVCYREINRPQEAEAAFKKALEISPDGVETYLNLGLLYARERRIQEAMVMADVVLERTPQSAKGQQLKGYVYFQNHQFRESIPYFTKAIELFPTYHLAWSNLGSAHGRLGEYGQAVQAFKQAHEIVPNNTKYIKLLDLATKDAQENSP